ncbi:575_t:CDS:1 [Diversispora eburnea]|uniref:575_t:CDS:1 n=1 Tax=Diversispora eburnea TaxID=1213867 RepID=A0A9N8W8F2_9GLOM|nr:575_t:CDS:1 [Diversispora eburnea]
MEYRDIKPRYKILKELLDKYKTSSKRIYQIWRGEEAKKVTWDQPIPQFFNENNINFSEISMVISPETNSNLHFNKDDTINTFQNKVSPEIDSNLHINKMILKNLEKKKRMKSKLTQIPSAHISDTYQPFKKEIEDAEKILSQSGYKTNST